MTQGILVTGGAGYIGSHVVRQLGEAGERVVTLDNLSTGFREAVTHGELIVGHTGDQALVTRILAEHDIDTVMHFAAHTIVPESVATRSSTTATTPAPPATCCSAAQEAGVRHIVFSSTAAVYGLPPGGIAREDSPTAPINAYGTSKLMSEWMLRDLAAAGGPRYVALRYFNVAGSDPEGRIGQSTPEATLLVKVACEVACGKREALTIFGTDYDTPDGTGVRDYIHVEDLAAAHLDALTWLRNGGDSQVLNCGYGHGYSVREVVQAVERVTGQPLPVREDARRPGDPPTLVADANRIRELLGWTPKLDDLDRIVASSLNWERAPKYGA
jgi:UDP-glucose 4-epimerase